MQPLTIRLQEEELEKIKQLANHKKIPFLSEYIRSLIQIGLQVEEATEQFAPNSNSQNISNTDLLQSNDESLWEKMLIWELESRYLIRYLVDRLPEETDGQHRSFIKKAHEKAESHVAQLLKRSNGS